MTVEGLETEHKYLLEEGFDLSEFERCMLALRPSGVVRAQVDEAYFLTRGCPLGIFRHRHDGALHDLTWKSFGREDTEVRSEWAIDLDRSGGSQLERVRSFLNPLGILWEGRAEKTLICFEFPDCEVVWYCATTGGRTAMCLEVEALNAESLTQAKATIAAYERSLGLNPATRCRRPLVLLLFPEFPLHTAQYARPTC